MSKTPVVLIVFRRPQMTRIVLDAIRQAKPETLLVVADGPRPDYPDDVEACAATRAVIDEVDWDCTVLKEYSDGNLGCGRRPASGLSWAFTKVDEAIVLEDDCVPHPTFFRYCGELLERYRDDDRVMHITGSTYLARAFDTPYSYFFSQFNGAWGWATWARAWRYYDPAVRLWPKLRVTSWLSDLLGDRTAVRYWANEFEVACDRLGDVSYWDHQWTFACWANSGLTIAPRANLVSNIGCGPEATHMFGDDDAVANVPTTAMDFPLRHPPNVLQRREFDREFLREVILPRIGGPSALRTLAARVAPGFAKSGYHKLGAALRAAVR